MLRWAPGAPEHIVLCMMHDACAMRRRSELQQGLWMWYPQSQLGCPLSTGDL